MSETQQVNPFQAWQNEVNSLSNKIFYQTPEGQRWLMLMEQRFFYGPVLDPSKDVAWGHHNEGRNNFIRTIRAFAELARQGEMKVTNVEKETEHG
jgi:hypothetical protein